MAMIRSDKPIMSGKDARAFRKEAIRKLGGGPNAKYRFLKFDYKRYAEVHTR